MSLCRAAAEGDVAEIRRLLAGGAPVDRVESAPPRWTPLMTAASHGHVEAVRVLLDAGANPNIEDLDGFTAVTLAGRGAHWDVVELLAERGADFGEAGSDGATGIDLVQRCRSEKTRQRMLALVRHHLAHLAVHPREIGSVQAGQTCSKCGQPTDSCEYYWSGFGDSWDNFRHSCANPKCGRVRERKGIAGKFPKQEPADWTSCPFCGRSTQTPD